MSQDPNDLLNGAVLPPLPPQRPIIHDPGILESDATDRDRAQFYASAVASQHVHTKAVYGELDEMRGAINLVGRAVYEVRDHLRGLPPMREKFASSNDIAKAAGTEIAQRIDAESRDPRTPSPPPPAKVAEISADVMRIAVDRVKAEQWDAREAERKAAEAQRVELVSANTTAKRNFWWATAAGGVTTALAIIAWLVEHFHK